MAKNIKVSAGLQGSGSSSYIPKDDIHKSQADISGGAIEREEYRQFNKGFKELFKTTQGLTKEMEKLKKVISGMTGRGGGGGGGGEVPSEEALGKKPGGGQSALGTVIGGALMTLGYQGVGLAQKIITSSASKMIEDIGDTISLKNARMRMFAGGSLDRTYAGKNRSYGYNMYHDPLIDARKASVFMGVTESEEYDTYNANMALKGFRGFGNVGQNVKSAAILQTSYQHGLDSGDMASVFRGYKARHESDDSALNKTLGLRGLAEGLGGNQSEVYLRSLVKLMAEQVQVMNKNLDASKAAYAAAMRIGASPEEAKAIATGTGFEGGGAGVSLQNYGSLKAIEEVTGLSGIEGVTMRRYASEMEPAQIEKDYAAGKIPKKYYEGYKKIQKTTPSGNTGAWVMEKNINFVKKNIGFDAAMGVGVYQGSMREAGTVFNMDMSKGASAVKKTNESSILSVVSGIIKQYKAYLGQGDGDAAKQYLSQTFEDIKMDLAAAGREADIGKMSGYLEQIKDGRLVAPSNQDIFSPPSGGSNAKMNFGAKGSRAERHNNPLSLPWSPKRQAFLARKGISFTKGDAFTDDPTKYSGFFQTQEDGNLGAQYVMRNGPNAFNWYKKNHPHAKKIKEIMEKRGVFNRLDIDVGSDEMIKMTEEISRYENKGSTVKNRSRADTVNYDSRDYVRRENQSPLLDAVNKVGDNTSGEPLFTITSPWGD